MRPSSVEMARTCNATCVWLRQRWPRHYGNVSHHTGECWSALPSHEALERRGGSLGIDTEGVVRARFTLPPKKRQWQTRQRDMRLSGLFSPVWRVSDPLLPAAHRGARDATRDATSYSRSAARSLLNVTSALARAAPLGVRLKGKE